jgi:hypothetical protein
MVSAKICISINFFTSQKEGDGNMGLLAITDSICQSKVMEGLLGAVIATKELPSREFFLRFNEAAKEAEN